MSGPALEVTFERVFAFRVARSHLARRLPVEAHDDAAWGGLQDTVPRAALTALHARMGGVSPGSWEHPSLWQVWFRMSDYVVPARDFGVFTLGAMPRQQERSEPLLRTAGAVAEVLEGRSLPNSEVVEALTRRGGISERPHFALREACAAGRSHPVGRSVGDGNLGRAIVDRRRGGTAGAGEAISAVARAGHRPPVRDLGPRAGRRQP